MNEHRPVLLNEVVTYLCPGKGKIILDATVGGGGHAREIVERIKPDGLLIGVDRDEEALRRTREKLMGYETSFYKLVKENFSNFDLALKKCGVSKVDGALFDLGISSFHVDAAERGFSVNNDGPLDMRMDTSGGLTAFHVVNKYPAGRLCEVIRAFGEERYARRIARYITEIRKKSPIETTRQLAHAVLKAVGHHKWTRLHPATRTFQAIRIEVNKELDSLSEALKKLPSFLAERARVCVISFHSLEDRIVKNVFRQYSGDKIFRLINKKPIVPSESEIISNPRSRSAKMRIAEFIG